jgi:hypothetical protein
MRFAFHIELEGRLEVSRDAAHHPLGGALAFDKKNHVVGVAREAVAPLLQFAVESVHAQVPHLP